MVFILAGSMLINNVKIINNEQPSTQIRIKDSKIIELNSFNNINDENHNELTFNFSNAIAFPGLINSHEHLDFNLFPKLGNRIYNDYVEWGNDINEKDRELIDTIKEVPIELSYKWGLYKNLICGVTTVINHGNNLNKHYKNLPDVYSNYNYIHSIRFEKKWKFKILLTPNWRPFVIHIGEGTNEESINEINELIRWNILGRDIIGIHSIAANDKQGKHFKAIVWCPDSNLFLFNKTTNIPLLKSCTNILFGTDSTLTADWNFWNHLRLARDLNYLNDSELFLSISKTASKFWGLKTKGEIAVNKLADIVICKKKYSNNWETFYNINPEDILLIIKNGNVVFIDSEIILQRQDIHKNDLDVIYINSVKKYITKGIRELVQSIHTILPDFCFPMSI
jgi:cytosine/adenosine deaminase-related metal-dependent hydrolase